MFLCYVFQNLGIGGHYPLPFFFTSWFSSSSISFFPVTELVTELAYLEVFFLTLSASLSYVAAFINFTLSKNCFLQECNLVGTVSVFPYKLCLINLFLFQRYNFFQKNWELKKIYIYMQVEIAFLVARLFIEYCMCVYLN